MSRASLYLRRILLATSLWILLIVFRSNSLPVQLNAPVISIILFGLYAATNILFHLITFKECPKAFVELQKEISEAKMDLKKKGIKV